MITQGIMLYSKMLVMYLVQLTIFGWPLAHKQAQVVVEVKLDQIILR